MDKMVFFLNKYVIDKTTEGKIKPSVYQYDDLTKAEANFHRDLGNHMNDDTCTYAMLKVTNADGGEHCSKVFKRTAEQVITE